MNLFKFYKTLCFLNFILRVGQTFLYIIMFWFGKLSLSLLLIILLNNSKMFLQLRRRCTGKMSFRRENKHRLCEYMSKLRSTNFWIICIRFEIDWLGENQIIFDFELFNSNSILTFFRSLIPETGGQIIYSFITYMTHSHLFSRFDLSNSLQYI